MTEQVTVPDIRVRKRSRGAGPIVMITAYDTSFARVVDQADVDIILVGDSLAEVVLGWEDTLHVGIEDLAHHVGAVARAGPRALLVGDMPWLTYHLEASDTVRNAAVLVRAGAHAVKLEGGRRRVPAVRAICDAEIPVMGHLGRFAIVLEGVPDALAERVTAEVDIPTIGIGAGPACDGQVIVLHDLLGLAGPNVPKFVRRYAELGRTATEAVRDWAADVRAGTYPSEAESYHASAALREALGLSS